MTTRLPLALAASTIALSACPSAEELPPDDYPAVAGLTPAEDLDPELGTAEYALVVGETDVELIEGVTTPMWTYNGQTPGPLLQARVGDLVRVHVTNELDEPTTVHWHGMRVPVAMDGVAMDGVDPIAPGATFTYEFTVPDAGTFWYHPHIRSAVQVEAGLYGAVVVHEAEELAPAVDADRIFVVDDIRLDDDGTIAEVSTSHPDQMHGRHGNVFLVNGEDYGRDVDLAPGGVERWRIVNTANARTMVLDFPGLDVQEIGADAGLWSQDWTRPLTSPLILPAGARAELEVRLEGEEDAAFDMLLPDTDVFGNLIWVPYELLDVRLDPSREPSTAAGHTSSPAYDLPDAEPGDATDHELTFDAVNGPDGVEWRINGASWPDFEEWTVDRGEMQVVTIRNLLGPSHPFHLHGQLFTVLSRDGEPADEPGLRDTVLVGGLEDVTIAVDFDNPGTWMYHCHILEHAELGMMATVTVQ